MQIPFPLFRVEYCFQITVFRMGEGSQDIDLAILTALLKGKISVIYTFLMRSIKCLIYACMFKRMIALHSAYPIHC